MQHVEIDWVDLNLAIENDSCAVHYYLDRHTGQVILLTDAALQSAESITDPSSTSDGMAVDSIQQAILEAIKVLEDTENRYIPIPPINSCEKYSDMEEFISLVSDPKIHKQLRRALCGHDSYNQFMRILSQCSTEQQQWSAFRHQRSLVRCNEWLAKQDIEPPNPGRPLTLPQPTARESTNTTAERQELIVELALLLIYLSSWEEKSAPGIIVRKAWKGYTFNTLNALEDRGLIHQSRKAKSVTITEEGIHLASELDRRFKP